MNEYREAVRSIHATREVGTCVVIVGGKWGAGGRVCGHAQSEHEGSFATNDALCLACDREGVSLRHSEGIQLSYAGRDHQFGHETPPAGRAEAEERRAA